MGVHSRSSQLIRASHALFASLQQQATQSDLIAAFPALQDDFRTRYQLLSLHSWLVLSRLRGCGSAGGTLREELCERMWDDTFRAARQMGVSEFRIGSQVKMLQQSFLGSALAYDKGMADRTGDNLVLRQAIFRNIFFEEGLSGGVEDPQVHRMAAYVTLQAQHMQDNSPCELLLEGTLSWLPLQSSLPQQQQQKKKT